MLWLVCISSWSFFSWYWTAGQVMWSVCFWTMFLIFISLSLKTSWMVQICNFFYLSFFQLTGKFWLFICQSNFGSSYSVQWQQDFAMYIAAESSTPTCLSMPVDWGDEVLTRPLFMSEVHMQGELSAPCLVVHWTLTLPINPSDTFSKPQ